MEFVAAHPDWKWDIVWLSRNPSLTMEFVAAHPDWKWDMVYLSRNPSLTMEFVAAHPDRKWIMACLSRNPSLTMEFVAAHPDWKWDMAWLSGNPCTKEVQMWNAKMQAFMRSVVLFTFLHVNAKHPFRDSGYDIVKHTSWW
jgi:hypothetical protein